MMKFKLSIFALAILSFSSFNYAQQYTFNSKLIEGVDGDSIDLSLFEGGGQLPGTYLVDVLINGRQVGTSYIRFSKLDEDDEKSLLVPCLSSLQLVQYGVDIQETESQVEQTEDACFDIASLSGANAHFNFNALTLELSVPQIYLKKSTKGIANPELWNEGITAFILNYKATTTHTTYKSNVRESNDSTWVQLNSGLNLGAWRIRNNSTWKNTKSDTNQWENIALYAERGLYSLKSRLTLGERYTSGDVFDSVPFRGVMLATDDKMSPSSQYQYSPVVRGVARTQARVEVKQNGYTIYDGVVAPGLFELNDLSVSGASGDITVTVWETDGAPQEFVIPYQAPAVSVKEGYLRYSVMSGQYRPSDDNIKKQALAQGAAIYGLPWDMTVFTGIQLAEHYQSLLLGVGKTLGNFGALSVDITQNHSQRWGHDTQDGHSLQFRYNKEFDSNTQLSLASYQYDSKGFDSLSDTLNTYTKNGWKNNESSSYKQKSRFAVTLNQGLAEWGNISASGYRDDYWDRSGSDNTYNISYSVLIRNVTASLNWQKTQYTRENGRSSNDNIISVWLSVPLDEWVGGSTRVSYRYTEPSNGGDTHAVGLSGNAYEQRLNWNISQQYKTNSAENSNNGTLNLQWRGASGQINSNYSYSNHYNQTGIGVSGSVVAHRDGITLSQPFEGTAALIEAPGAANVKASSLPGIETDGRGYAIQPYLIPYQENTITLNPASFSSDIDVKNTNTKVVPTEGAVIPAKFITQIGAKALFNLKFKNGKVVPFGTLVTVDNRLGINGIVGEQGNLYLSGIPEEGLLQIKLKNEVCSVKYQLPPKKNNDIYYQLSAICQ
ncbi:fimbria/pilus outer membrane usher protein [Providencia stuartii]|uniref:fimbria/pilus outer membrane usher protein n=1 Tax=Providencia stuartii TaxID=588 RepID=UPI0032DBB403